MAKFIPIEDVLNIFDNTRLWYYIPSFNGYEVSNDGYIRSMKHYRKHPYGVLIQPVARDRNKGIQDPMYELSNDDNVRQRIRLSQIIYLAKTNNFSVSGYPRSTIMSSNSGRNKFVRNKDGVYVKVYNGPKVTKSFDMPQLDNTLIYPKFTVIQDGTEAMNMTYQQPEYKIPIKSVEGDEYYGRKDCRTICNINVHSGSS
jgi:hypothetical protein